MGLTSMVYKFFDNKSSGGAVYVMVRDLSYASYSK